MNAEVTPPSLPKKRRWTVEQLERKQLHDVWRKMKDRCCEPSDPAYPWYGGRGILVCERWMNSFDTFLRDMGPRPSGFSLDRTNPDEGYAPSNCLWVPKQAQQLNRRCVRMVQCGDELVSLRECCRRVGENYGTILYRVTKGMSVEQAFAAPKNKGRPISTWDSNEGPNNDPTTRA
jgi:hypothetical protein